MAKKKINVKLINCLIESVTKDWDKENDRKINKATRIVKAADSNRGQKRCPEFSLQMSILNSGKKQSSDVIAKRKKSISEKGKFNHSDETKAKLSSIHKGRKFTNEQKKEIWPEERRTQMSLANIGRKHSDETKAKLSKLRKDKPVSALQLQVMREVYKKRKDTKLPETQKAKISAALKGRVFSDIHRAKISEGLRKRHAAKKLQSTKLSSKGETK